MSFGLVARYRGAVHHDSSRLFVAVSINAFGAGMFFPFALLYYQKATSLSVSTIGFAITTATLITLLVNPVSGALVVRFGSKRIVVYGQLMEAVGFAGYLFVTSASSLFFAALIATSGTRMFYAAFSALIADSVSGSDRDRWYGIVGVSQTVGGSLSGIAATLLIGSVGLNGFRIIIAANVCCLVISSFLLHTSREQRQHRTAAGTSITLIHVLRDRKYMLLVASNGLFILCSMLMGLAFALYAIDGLDAPLWSIAVIGIVSSAMVVCLQSRVVEAVRLCRRTSVMMFAGTLWALACFVFAMAIFIPQPLVVPYLVLAAAIFTTSKLSTCHRHVLWQLAWLRQPGVEDTWQCLSFPTEQLQRLHLRISVFSMTSTRRHRGS